MSDERIANLKKWAELAPGECEIWHASQRPEFRIIAKGWVLPSQPLLKDTDQARLLLALIEAIRARGDSMGSAWYLNMYVDSSGMSAEIKRGLLPVGEEHEAPEPCDALLSAYVHALSALTEGRER